MRLINFNMGNIFFKSGCEKISSKSKSFYELEAIDIDESPVKMDRYKDKNLLLIVNVASNCGLTKKNYQ